MLASVTPCGSPRSLVDICKTEHEGTWPAHKWGGGYVQAREYMYWRLNGMQHTTPVALMTSDAKGNHGRVQALLEHLGHFGRGTTAFRPGTPWHLQAGCACMCAPAQPRPWRRHHSSTPRLAAQNPTSPARKASERLLSDDLVWPARRCLMSLQEFVLCGSCDARHAEAVRPAAG